MLRFVLEGTATLINAPAVRPRSIAKFTVLPIFLVDWSAPVRCLSPGYKYRVIAGDFEHEYQGG